VYTHSSVTPKPDAADNGNKHWLMAETP